MGIIMGIKTISIKRQRRRHRRQLGKPCHRVTAGPAWPRLAPLGPAWRRLAVLHCGRVVMRCGWPCLLCACAFAWLRLVSLIFCQLFRSSGFGSSYWAPPYSGMVWPPAPALPYPPLTYNLWSGPSQASSILGHRSSFPRRSSSIVYMSAHGTVFAQLNDPGVPCGVCGHHTRETSLPVAHGANW